MAIKNWVLTFFYNLGNFVPLLDFIWNNKIITKIIPTQDHDKIVKALLLIITNDVVDAINTSATTESLANCSPYFINRVELRNNGHVADHTVN